jgi:tRNA modification GTPase
VSGPGSIACVSNIIPALRVISQSDSRRLVHDFALDNGGAFIDEVTAIPYFAPKSYTAEEMVEIICHGGFTSSRVILDKLYRNGARLAEPGEFTRRAFLNGRISLSQSEAVAAAIEARSELALKAAARNLRGELCQQIDAIRAELGNLLSLIEAEIDFSEEEIDKLSPAKIIQVISNQLFAAEKILSSYDFGRGLNSGLRVAIIGKTNVGKSSLLNALLNRDRAIVTEIPGTTRDTLTEWIDIRGFPVLLSDTAGLRHSAELVERIGQEKTRDVIELADLVLLILDGSAGISSEDVDIFEQIKEKRKLLTVNKIDLGLAKGLDAMPFPSEEDPVMISALRGDGLDDLKARIAHMLSLDSFKLESALLATERQYQAMDQACTSLRQTLDEFRLHPAPEVVSVFLRETLDHLGELVGETTTEEILNSIFSRFCIGK